MDKEQRRLRDREYYYKNLEKIRKRKRIQMREYRKNNKERVREIRKKYYEKNKDKLNAKTKENYKKNYYKYRERALKQGREYYKKNKVEIYTRKKKVIKEHQDFVLNYKRDKSCSICYYKEYPEILEFHHKRRADKSFTIGKKYNKNLKLLKSEMDKCVLLCPNCHRWLHYQESMIKDWLC